MHNKDLLCNCGFSQAPTTLPVLMTSYKPLSNKFKLNRKLYFLFKQNRNKEEIKEGRIKIFSPCSSYWLRR